MTLFPSPLVASSLTNQKASRTLWIWGVGVGGWRGWWRGGGGVGGWREDLQIAKQMYLRVLLCFTPTPHTQTHKHSFPPSPHTHSLSPPPPLRLDPGTRQEPPAFTVWWVCIEISTCLGFMCLSFGWKRFGFVQKGDIRPRNGVKTRWQHKNNSKEKCKVKSEEGETQVEVVDLDYKHWTII